MRTGTPSRRTLGTTVMQPDRTVRRAGTSRLRRLFFAMLLVGGGTVIVFLAFNWSVPFLKHGLVDHAILDGLSRAGAILVPLGVVLTIIGYVGILLTPRTRVAPPAGACASGEDTGAGRSHGENPPSGQTAGGEGTIVSARNEARR